jgi:hypothetical protein
MAPRAPAATPSRAAWVLSAMVAVLMVAASAAGLWVHGLYRDAAWASAAFRGGDLVTLVVAAPALTAALLLARRGSRRAELVWAGTLAYAVYTYAFLVFGAAFNVVFLLHVALFSLSLFGTGSVSNAAAEYGRQHGITVIDGGCPLMFDPAADPGHKVMRLVFTMTGKVPRRVCVPGDPRCAEMRS